MTKIPFNQPYLTGNEFAYMREAITCKHISGGGGFSKKCESILEQALGVPKVLLTTSCTDALEMAALLLDIKEGDEVIVPSFTFPSTATAFALRGARIVFADIRKDTLNIDENSLYCLITPKTKAILIVHYNGVSCELTKIMDLARQRKVPVIEDNAHGLYGNYQGKSLGTFGTFGTLSFHETKSFSCGEGGALLINDPQYIKRAEILLEKGTNRSQFFRGEIERYTWVDLGSSFVLSDLLAAFLYAQLESKIEIMKKRERIWMTYFDALSNWALENNVLLPEFNSERPSTHHLFYLLMPSPLDRQNLLEHFQTREISALFHYQPLHLSLMGTKVGELRVPCKVSEWVGERIIRLPFFTEMSLKDMSRVINAILDFQFCVHKPEKHQENYQTPTLW